MVKQEQFNVLEYILCNSLYPVSDGFSFVINTISRLIVMKSSADQAGSSFEEVTYEFRWVKLNVPITDTE